LFLGKALRRPDRTEAVVTGKYNVYSDCAKATGKDPRL